MKRSPFGASRERAVKLMAAGCPIDYPDALVLNSASRRQSFHVEQPLGYGDSRVYKFGGLDAGWVIPLRLRTDRPSGTVIRGWDLELPDENHAINWDCEPEEVIPKKDWEDYQHLFKSRLRRVLEGHLIRRGSPVEGVLCGRSYQQIEESSPGFLSARLSFTDDLGTTVSLPIQMNVLKLKLKLKQSSASRVPGGQARRRLFADLVDLRGQSSPGAMPAVRDGKRQVGNTPFAQKTSIGSAFQNSSVPCE